MDSVDINEFFSMKIIFILFYWCSVLLVWVPAWQGWSGLGMEIPQGSVHPQQAGDRGHPGGGEQGQGLEFSWIFVIFGGIYPVAVRESSRLEKASKSGQSPPCHQPRALGAAASCSLDTFRELFYGVVEFQS